KYGKAILQESMFIIKIICDISWVCFCLCGNITDGGPVKSLCIKQINGCTSNCLFRIFPHRFRPAFHSYLTVSKYADFLYYINILVKISLSFLNFSTKSILFHLFLSENT